MEKRDANNELLANLKQLHTTELGAVRIWKNLSDKKISEPLFSASSPDADAVAAWCQTKIKSPNATITRKGKNWYINVDGCVITVNAYSYTIITAHMEKKK